MPTTPWDQAPYRVRFDWGPTAAAALADDTAALVVVDVLSFTTAVSVAADRGTAVHPAPWGDARAEALVRDLDARLAVGQWSVTGEQPWSLSPAALRAAPAPERLVLPSPNGSAIAASARGLVVAAGERWPDGSLRPALEDLLGAGAVLAALPDGSRSPEAEAAAAVSRGTRSVPDAVRTCASGVELVEAGFAEDVEIAVELDRSSAVPVLRGGAFRA